MRKNRLLLVAVFALVGMSAFAQLPTDQSIGYLYDAAAKKFINAEGKVGATGMPFKALKQGSSKDYTTKDGTNRTFTSYRFKTTDGSKGLGIDNTNGTTASTNGIVTSTGTYGYGVFAVVPVGETGFRIMSTYNRADFNVDYLYDYCLGYKEDGTLFCFPEAEAPVWQFVDEETYKTTVAANAMPNANDVGYLYNLATKQFISANAVMDDSFSPIDFDENERAKYEAEIEGYEDWLADEQKRAGIKNNFETQKNILADIGIGKIRKPQKNDARYAEYQGLSTRIKNAFFTDVETAMTWDEAEQILQQNKGDTADIFEYFEDIDRTVPVGQDTYLQKDIFNRVLAKEKEDIKQKAVADGTFLKAPNGKASV